MAFIRKKLIQGRPFYYLVESQGRLQKHIAYLGKEIPRELLPLYKKRGKR